MSRQQRTEAAGATLIEVAELAGVSRATAARALGNYGSVKPDTAKRVAQAAKKLNYRTNKIARAMREGRTATIGLVIGDITASFFEQAILAIIRTASEHGYQTLVLNTDEDLQAEAEAVRNLLQKRVDGLIVVPCSGSEQQHLLSGDGPVAPMVLLDRRGDAVPTLSVTTDDLKGARSAIEVFAGHGHRRIGYLGSVSEFDGQPAVPSSGMAVSTVFDRYEGARLACAELGLALDPDLVDFYSPRRESPVAIARELLERPDRPTAVLAANAEMSLAVYQACRELGLAVGRDLSVVGFDDSAWAPVLEPPLTVVARPVVDLATIAVRQLLGHIGGERSPAGSIVLATHLIERGSVGPPPA